MIVFFVLLSLFVFPNPTMACEVKPHAKKYMEQIQNVFGGEKPDLVIEKGSDEETLAFYDREDKAIHIYKGDYKGACEDNLPTLRVVIAHEYAHHLNSKIRNIAWIEGRENLAETSEHAIADAIWGSAKVTYDADLDPQYLQQYQKIFTYVKTKMNR